MDLTIYQEVRLDSVRYGATVEHPRYGPIVVSETRQTLEGVELLGARPDANVTRRHTINGAASDTVRLFPSADTLASVWGSLAEAVETAAKAEAEDEDLVGDTGKWQVIYDPARPLADAVLVVNGWTVVRPSAPPPPED